VSDEFPEWAGYRLIMVVPMDPPGPGRVAVLLMCSCSRVTPLEFDAAAVGETGRSGVCAGCRTVYWFHLPAGPEDDDG
jgi:hypothetical protein